MKFSIIIPVLNEAKTIKNTLKMVKELAGNNEIIVVDGGSTDNTVSLAGEIAGVRVVISEKGRALQMNKGAELAQGDVLFFLHSDSIVDPQVLKGMEEALQDSQVVGGGLTLKIDDQKLIFRLISLGSNLRVKFSKIYFGDQGIFVRTNIFREIGGFPHIELMEDWEFSKALKKKGKLVQIPNKIITSARRWHKGGIWPTIIFMHKLKILYKLGVSPRELRNRYYDVR